MSTPKILLIGFAIIVGLLLAKDVPGELSPIAGQWRVEAVVEGGVTRPALGYGFSWLEVEPGGYGSLSSYHTCGARAGTWIEGYFERNGDKYLVFKSNWATGERAEHLSGEFLRLSNGRLGYRDGSRLLVLRSERNAETVLDLIGWQ